MINQNFAIVGALLPVAGGLHYAIDTLRGKIQPNRVSWLIWSLAPFIAFSAELAQHIALTIALLTFAVGFANLLVVFASFANPKAFWKLTKFDLFCGSVSVLAIILWSITGSGNLAILLCIVADLCASIPTILKLNKYPETELGIVYFASAIGALLTLLTVQKWTFANFGFPLYYLLIDCAFIVVVLLSGLGAYPAMAVARSEENNQKGGR